MISQDIIRYIISFLCRTDDSEVVDYVDYCKDPVQSNGTVIIQQSNFFDEGMYGTLASEPMLPLSKIGDTPILFGSPKIEKYNGKIIICADLIASTYFLISRYEEMLHPDDKDQNGRFPGKQSLPYRAGFIDRPIVEEYGRILRNCLRKRGIEIAEPIPGFPTVYLTHDVDVPWEQFNLLSAAKRMVRELIRERKLVFYPLATLFGKPYRSPYYTFSKLIDADDMLPSSQKIFFIKSDGYSPPNDYYPYIRKKPFLQLLQQLKNSGAEIGYHVSFFASVQPKAITDEVALLRKVTKLPITNSRNHYLASLRPSDFCALIESGITGDFTMGYADVAGFRLGTCRAVRWINPGNCELTMLMLHPLTIMDCTLVSERYMALNETKSQDYGDSLIRSCYENTGEVTLLWHNSTDTGNRSSVTWKNYLHFLDTMRKYQQLEVDRIEL